MDILEYAIQMELDGQKYYLDQAELNKENELQKVFLFLAASEEEHAKIIRKRLNKEALELGDNLVRPDKKHVFSDLKSFPKENAEKQLNVYRLAMSLEEKSIQLYQEYLEQSMEQQDKDLFAFLIDQEKEHYRLFEDLVIMLTRPEEWVESAEFGLREEY